VTAGFLSCAAVGVSLQSRAAVQLSTGSVFDRSICSIHWQCAGRAMQARRLVQVSGYCARLMSYDNGQCAARYTHSNWSLYVIVVTVYRTARHRKGMEAGTAEKKIAILERGLDHHPGSEEVLLALLNVVRVLSGQGLGFWTAATV